MEGSTLELIFQLTFQYSFFPFPLLLPKFPTPFYNLSDEMNWYPMCSPYSTIIHKMECPARIKLLWCTHHASILLCKMQYFKKSKQSGVLFI